MEHLIDIWGDVLAWAAVLAVVVACAGLAARIGPRNPKAPLVTKIAELAAAAEVAEVPTIEGPRRLDPAREWGLVIVRATLDPEKPAALAALQAEAEVKIAAAEHAFDRLVGDCANLCPLSATPTVLPPLQRVAVRRGLPRALERQAERKPLAAQNSAGKLRHETAGRHCSSAGSGSQVRLATHFSIASCSSRRHTPSTRPS
jgi:hypothetical protein